MIWHLLGVQLLAFCGVLVAASFGEWLLHKYVMHRRFPLFSYPYKLHTISHHSLFLGDETYTAKRDDPRAKHVTFAPLDYLLVLSAHGALFLAFEWLTGIVVMIGGLAAILMYLVAFDVLHYCWHIPSDTRFQRTCLFRWMKERHQLHHGNPTVNMNLILPIADFAFGTLRRPKG